MRYDYLFKTILDQCLVFDIETYSEDWEGNPIPINSHFDQYVEMADVRWFGAYSFKHNKTYLLEYKENIGLIKQLLADHDILVHFNGEEFDYPILVNNGLTDTSKRYLQVDCMQIMGNNTFKNKSGYKYKGRGELMKYKFKKNSLKHMAEVMKFDVKKGEIDFNLFKKTTYTEDEKNEIKAYLNNDVEITKQIFNKLWDFWKPFTNLLSQNFVQDLSWIRGSIAAITYKAACSLMGVEPTYGSAINTKTKESMGGHVIMPKYQEKKNVWYVDYVSLYPHIFCMFNLFGENTDEECLTGFHGNDVFKVRGYYFENSPHMLVEQVKDKLKERIELKKLDEIRKKNTPKGEKFKKNPMVYAIKVFLNGLYGVARSAIFEKVGGKDCGYDCCWLGQQIQKLTENMMAEFGFESIYGDTDSVMFLANKPEYDNQEYVQECLNKIIAKINANVPFPVDTFDIKIEKRLNYIMFPFSMQELVDKETRSTLNEISKMDEGDFHPNAEAMGELYKFEEIDKKKCVIDKTTNEVVKKGRSWVKTLRGKKKNYAYIHNDKIKLIGLPIKKCNATCLGIKIYKEELEPLIIKQGHAKFSREFIENIVNDWLKRDGILQLISQEYKVKPADTYKKENQIHAQISRGYFDGRDGIVNLIKNTKIGNAGQGTLYCTVQEAIDNNLTVKDIDFEKLWNELEPFIKYEKPVVIDKLKKVKVKKEIKVNKSEVACYYEE